MSVEVVLVSMPWAPVHEPSLALGLLQSCLEEHGHDAATFHFSTELLRWVSAETYQMIADSWAVNEFLFTASLDRDEEPDDHQLSVLLELCGRYAESRRSRRYVTAQELFDTLLTIRRTVIPEFLADCAEQILRLEPNLVGFTCMFDQTMASLALAASLRARSPELWTAMGGYALSGPPGETVRTTFDHIDTIVLGDGEQAIVELARAARHGEERPAVLRGADSDLELVPIPTYDDWFEFLSHLAETHSITINTRILPIEASRGCWWGQRKHCVFCGIDDDALRYRFRSAERTIETLGALRERYGDEHVFRFADYIMPKDYYDTLLPKLAAEPVRYSLEGEIKANHSPERVRLLAEAGFGAVQPGVESFSTPVLRKMDKGVRGIDNVLLLRASYENRLVLYYNVLYGFPDEDPRWYLDMLAEIPKLYHLVPPISRTEVVVTRNAPLQSDPHRFGLLGRARHAPCYETLFRSDFLESTGFDLDAYCYYFERNYDYAEGTLDLYRALDHQIDHWKDIHRKRFVELSLHRTADGVSVVDSRFGPCQTIGLSRPGALLLDQLGDGLARVDRATAVVSERHGERAALDAVEEVRAHRLIWEESGLAVALPVDAAIVDDHRRSGWKDWWMALAP